MEAQQLLDRLNYHKSFSSSTNAINNLTRMNPKLNDNNILTHAYLATNPAISEEERKIYFECLRVKAMTDYEIYSKEIERIESRREKYEE
jgi:hypothetical protein